ncbi:serine/threonine-protein kinase prpf4B-like isoform X2 [Macrobrachium nipponense]|uniref:serine/threonine-protein kinase prpf4B-like isoform X2 n=1 Tax=Macrobrachium nipponense TaxID=159736 RepID=UPI0030C8598E
MEELGQVGCFSAADIKIDEEFLEGDNPSVSDSKDPDCVEGHTSKVNQLELNVLSNSEEYAFELNQSELKDASSGDSSVIAEEKSAPVLKKRKRLPKEDRDEERGKDDETEREKIISEDKDEERGKDDETEREKIISEDKDEERGKDDETEREKMISEDKDEERGKDDETDREKIISVCKDEEEQKDMDEISLLLSIRDSVQKVAQTQNEIADLIVDFVKKRQSL